MRVHNRIEIGLKLLVYFFCIYSVVTRSLILEGVQGDSLIALNIWAGRIFYLTIVFAGAIVYANTERNLKKEHCSRKEFEAHFKNYYKSNALKYVASVFLFLALAIMVVFTSSQLTSTAIQIMPLAINSFISGVGLAFGLLFVDRWKLSIETTEP